MRGCVHLLQAQYRQDVFKNAARSLALSGSFNTLLILALMSDFCFLS